MQEEALLDIAIETLECRKVVVEPLEEQMRCMAIEDSSSVKCLEERVWLGRELDVFHIRSEV